MLVFYVLWDDDIAYMGYDFKEIINLLLDDTEIRKWMTDNRVPPDDLISSYVIDHKMNKDGESLH